MIVLCKQFEQWIQHKYQRHAKSAKDVLKRGISYIRRLEEREFEVEQGLRREELEGLTQRSAFLYGQLDSLMPGCGSPERA